MNLTLGLLDWLATELAARGELFPDDSEEQDLFFDAADALSELSTLVDELNG